MSKLTEEQREAKYILKDNIREWITSQLKKGQLLEIEEATFNEFEIHPKYYKPLVLKALEEVVKEMQKSK